MLEISGAPSTHETSFEEHEDVLKIYVVDTNVLLHDPTAITAFAEHKVVIPMTVLEELDNIKDRRDKDVSREARIAINAIDKHLEGATSDQIQNGVKIQSVHGQTGSLAIYPDQLLDHTGSPATKNLLSATTQQQNDNRIINTAIQLQSDTPDAKVILITKSSIY